MQSNKLVFANFNAKQWVRVTSYPPVTKMPAYRGSPRKRRVSDDFAPSAERKKVKLKAKRALRTSRNDANTLERLIPTPTDFEGLNQPFLLEVERSNMKLRSLWQQFGVHVCSNKAVLLEALAPGGVLVIAQPTERNLERWDGPPAKYLLKPGELRELATPLEILTLSEAWRASDRHEAWLVGRKLDELRQA